jgi:hypothetical protein
MTEEYNSLPNYYDVMYTPKHDDSSDGYLVHTIEPANNNQAGLNNSQNLTYKYAGDSKVIRLHPLRCGFRVRAAFRTKSAPGAHDANNESEANITLSSGWFWHLFDNYKLKVANNNDVESLSYPGIFADTMNLTKGSEFKNTYGELCGYIPDEGNGKADPYPDVGATCSIKKSELTAITGAAGDADAGTKHFTVTMNTAKWRNYNNGFIKRMSRYNYEVADDNNVRYIEEFFPLSQISGFFSTDTCLMNTAFEITLKRKASANYKDAVFGSGTTDMDFGNTIDTGLLKVTLELWEQKPNLRIEAKLAATFEQTDKTPKPISFLGGVVAGKYQIGFSQEYTISETSYHIPRYVLLIFKGAEHEGANAANNLAYQSESPNKNFSLNAHANIEHIIVTINGQSFPNTAQEANFSENSFSKFYQSYVATCDSLNQDPCLSMNDFRDNYFVGAFDCSDQTKKESTKTTNLQVRIKRRGVPRANTDRKNPRFLDCYMIVLEDRFVQLDAKKGVCTLYSMVV